MRYADINKRFTDIVAEYIKNGYTINTGTMVGSQGEIAKIDLTNGSEIIRVIFDKCTLMWNVYHNGYRIFVGKSDKCELINAEDKIFTTIWNNDLVEVSSERFFHADYDGQSELYLTEEEKERVLLQREKRHFYRCVNMNRLPSNASEVAYKYVKRRMNLARARKADINIYKQNDGKYCITYRNRSWVLK